MIAEDLSRDRDLDETSERFEAWKKRCSPRRVFRCTCPPNQPPTSSTCSARVSPAAVARLEWTINIAPSPRGTSIHTEELAEHVKGIMMPATLFLSLMLFQTLRAISVIDRSCFRIAQDFVGYGGGLISKNSRPSSTWWEGLPSEMAINFSSASGEEFLSGWYFRLNFWSTAYQHSCQQR